MGNPNYIVGHDEHGPAYPDPASQWPHHPSCAPIYLCPICKGDRHRYLTCDYPACPDGRDQGRYFERFETGLSKPTPPWPVAFVGWAVMVAVLVYMAWPLH